MDASHHDKHDRARDRASARARARPPSEPRCACAAAACERVLELPEVADARAVLAYAAAPEELDPQPLLDALRDRGSARRAPRVAGPGALLDLHWVDTRRVLEAGPFGICAAAARAPSSAPTTSTSCSCPAWRSTRAAPARVRRRLLRPLLAALPGRALGSALAFDEQVVERSPPRSTTRRSTWSSRPRGSRTPMSPERRATAASSSSVTNV